MNWRVKPDALNCWHVGAVRIEFLGPDVPTTCIHKLCNGSTWAMWVITNGHPFHSIDGISSEQLWNISARTWYGALSHFSMVGHDIESCSVCSKLAQGLLFISHKRRWSSGSSVKFAGRQTSYQAAFRLIRY